MKHKFSRKGFLVLALAVGMCFITILFTSMAERMRNEAAITNRVSITERLDQISCAVGRISIRKLQTDIDFRDEFGQDVIEKIFDNPTTTSFEFTHKAEAFTRTINNMSVIHQLKKDYNKIFHDKIKNFLVTYTMYFENNGFGEVIPGSEVNPFERKGHIDLAITTILESGIKRKYIVRKDFILAYLLPQPFHHFTLFSPNGANISDSEINSISYNNSGKVISSKSNLTNPIPLVCVNALHNNDDKYNFNFKSKLENNGSFENFREYYYKNGWIYLGNSNSTDMATDSNGDKNLILNVVPGLGDDEYESSFGEFFHLYYNKSNSGWLIDNKWSSWLATKSGIDICKMVSVDYGLYNGLFSINPYGDDEPLFANVEGIYKKSFHNESDLTYGSALHLFGTSTYCTPTLVLGNIHSRYLRCMGLYFTDIGKVFAFSSIPGESSISGRLITGIFNNMLSLYISSSSVSDAVDRFDKISDAFYSEIFIDATNNPNNPEFPGKYYNSYNGMRAIGPRIIDTKPIVSSLYNILFPTEPGHGWSDKPCLKDIAAEPDMLCSNDFNFGSSSKIKDEIKYNGLVNDIRIDYENYLKNKTTYTFGKNNDSDISISDEFFTSHFFKKEKDNKEHFSLNQIIRVEGNLTIDKELNVAKGGIILCTGKIKIEAPIYNDYLERESKNKYIFKASENQPDNFGYLTLIAKDGIDVAGLPKISDDTLPSLHGFFIAGCDKSSTSGNFHIEVPIHVIGGVATDNIKDLVSKGSVIEWGFSPDEVTELKNKDFYGLSLGPRDIEIYTSVE